MLICLTSVFILVYNNNMKYEIIEGIHTDPGNIETIDPGTRKVYGPFDKIKAELLAGSIVRDNVDNYYHRAWIRPAKIKIAQ